MINNKMTKQMKTQQNHKILMNLVKSLINYNRESSSMYILDMDYYWLSSGLKSQCLYSYSKKSFRNGLVIS